MSVKQTLPVKHFLQFKDFNRDEFEYLFERTRIIKQKFKAYQQYWPLTDRTLVMIFEKASTRTRLSFEAGMQQLGGAAIYLNTRDSQLGRGEPEFVDSGRSITVGEYSGIKGFRNVYGKLEVEFKNDAEAAKILELVRYANVHTQKPLTREELIFIAKYPEQARKIMTVTP